MINKTLFLSSYEYKSFAIPRKIEQYTWGSIEERDCLIVGIDVPVDGRKYDLPNNHITTLYLLNRFADDIAIFQNLNSFPIEVHVLISKSSTLEVISSYSQFKHIVWATLYDNLKDAESHIVV
jgi:hypothetical protein